MALSEAVVAAYEYTASGAPVTLKDLREVVTRLTPQFEPQPVEGGDRWFDGPDEQAVDRTQWVEVIEGVCAAAQASGISEAQLLAVLSPPESQEGPESEGVLDPSEEAAEGERDHWVAPGEGGDGNEEVVEVGPEEEAAPRPHYVHPADGRAYLESEVLPTLRQGMAALVAQLEREKLKLAAGNDWVKPDGFLPHDWLPFSPYRWLANWLVEHSPEPPVTTEPPYGTFTPNRKAELWFDAVMNDYLHNSGATDHATAGATAGVAGSTIYESEDSLPLRAVCEKLRVLRADLTPEDLAGHLGHQEGLQGEEDAQGQEAAEAGHEELSLGREEAVRLVVALADQVADASGQQEAEYRLDALVHSSMGQHMLEYCTSVEDKYRFIYLTLDSGEAGYQQSVLAEQLLQLLPRGLGMSQQEAVELLEAGGRRATDTVTCAEVQDILSHVLPPGTDTADERLVQLVSTAAAIARGLPSDLVSAIAAPSHNPLEEVEPEELAEYIRSLPTFSVVPLVSTSEVQDYSFSQRTSLLASEGGAEAAPPARPTFQQEPSMLHAASVAHRQRLAPQVLLIDVRTQEEIEVSGIPGAIHAPAVANASAVRGWSLARDEDIAALRERVDLANIRGQATRLILYCDAGARSGALAAHLKSSGLLGSSVDVAVMCGGIINYFNLGGCVKDPVGAVVQAVHPGSPEMKPFITRPNKFKLF